MADLCVVGFVYFEVVVPAGPPKAGTEEFLKTIPVRLGGAFHTAEIASQLGLAVELYHPGGLGLTDHAIKAELSRHRHFRTRAWPADPDPAVTLVYQTEGDRSFVSAADFESLRRCPPLPESRWIHVAGLREAEHLAMRLSDARQRGAKISVAGSWAPELLAGLKEKRQTPWDLLVLNSDEARAAAGDPMAVWESLSGVAQEIVVTDGENGAFTKNAGAMVRVKPKAAVDTKDPTGAGDAFCAGLLCAKQAGFSVRESVDFASDVARRALGTGPNRLAQLSACKKTLEGCS